MEADVVSSKDGKTKIRYFIKGDSPTLLIDTGTHGDEYQVIPLVKNIISRYEELLPSFIYIPEVSPSAVRLKTRENSNGLDVNRNFFDKSSDQEVQLIQTVIKNNNFTLSVSFHEADGDNEFYIYDSENHFRDASIKNLLNEVMGMGVNLLDGKENEEDPLLGYIFNKGYAWCTKEQNSADSGFMWTWMYRNKIARRLIIPEISKDVNEDKKSLIIASVFRNLVIK